MNIKQNIILPVLAIAGLWLMSACGEDFQSDIDKLNAQHGTIEGRVSKLETQVTTLNTQIGSISALAYAVEQGFYVTQVKTTADGYELTLSNGKVIVLQNTPDGTLVPMPAVSMTQISGLYFWTINGIVLTGDDGQPVRAGGTAPVVRYDYTVNQWVISIDGGVTFRDISEYVSVIINDQILLKVINSYVSHYQNTIISQQVLYQIISIYIQQNYKELFSINILNQVVDTYIKEHYTRIFSYELLEKIFTQYNFSYVKDNIKVDELVSVIVQFIKDHKEVFVNNEVLYAIITNYIEMNKTTIFTNELLWEVINNFFENNENFIDVELLTQVVNNYIDQHTDVVFNTETIKNMMTDYVKKWYVQIFSQDILIRVLSTYVTEHSETIFNRTLIEEVINNYIQNNSTTIISQDKLVEIVNNYLKANSSTVFNRELLIEIITKYFEKDYSIYIKREDIETAINNYISTHDTTIISIEVIRKIMNNYLENNFREVFTKDFLQQVVTNYFRTHMEIIAKYADQEGKTIISDVQVADDICTVTLSGGEIIKLVVYDAMARLSKRVQSIVILPNSEGYVDEGNTLNLRYLVSPASMASVIANNSDLSVELIVTDGGGSTDPYQTYGVQGSTDGILSLSANMLQNAKAVALHVKDKKIAGTDIMTEFVVVGEVDCSGIPSSSVDPTPSIWSSTITIPNPNIQTEINECGNCVATLNLTGIKHPNTQEWLYLYGTGMPGQNVWIDVDDTPRGNVAINLEDNTTMVQNDIVFTVDNSSSMGQEANAIATQIESWAEMLIGKNLNVRFGVVGYGGYVDGAINLTSASSLKAYLDRTTGTGRTKGYGGNDASTLQSYASKYPKTGSSYDSNECGAMAIHFADDYFDFRTGANRIYINFTDEGNQPNGNSNYSVDWFNSQANWPTWKGTIHTVWSGTSVKEGEAPWLMSDYTGGIKMDIKSNASDLNLNTLEVSEAMTHSYTIRFLVPRALFDGNEHNVRITIKSTDNAARGVLEFNHRFEL